MSQEQSTSGDQAGRTEVEQPNIIARAVDALKQRTRQALSPWVQRRLESAGTRPSGPADLGAHRPALLTAGNTHSLLNRLQRTVDRATVWKPSVGALNPDMVQRFARTVVNRVQPLDLVGIRRQARPREVSWGEQVELTLPTGPAPSGPLTRESTGGTQIQGPSIFTVGQRIPPMRPTPSAGPRTPRTGTPAQAPRRAQRKPLPRDARLFSRVEEVTSGRQAPAEARPPIEAPAEVELESEPEAGRETPVEVPPAPRLETASEQPRSRPEPRRTVEPPQVQRKPEPGVPARRAPERPAEASSPERPVSEIEEIFAGEPPDQTREEPEMPLRAVPSRETPAREPERAPEVQSAEAPVQRQVEPEAARRPTPPETAMPEPRPVVEPPVQPDAEPAVPARARPPERELEPRQKAEPGTIQRSVHPAMPLRTESLEVEAPESQEPRPEPPPIQREAEAESPDRAEPPVTARPPEQRPGPRRAARSPRVQREAEAPRPVEAKELPGDELPPIQGVAEPEEPVRVEPTRAVAVDSSLGEPELRREAEPPLAQEAAGLSETTVTEPSVSELATRIEPEVGIPPRMPPSPEGQPERPAVRDVSGPAEAPPLLQREIEAHGSPPRPEAERAPRESLPGPRRGVEPPPVQPAEEPEMPLQAVGRPDIGGERPEPAPRAVEPPMVQRQEEPEQPPRVTPPARRPERRSVAEVPPVQRQEAPEQPPQATPPEELSLGQPEQRPERRRVVEAPPLQRQEEAERPSQVGPPERRPERRRVVEAPPLQRQEEAERPLQATPPERRSERRRAVEVPPLQRKEEPSAPSRVEREVPPSEGDELPATLGRDILTRAASRAQLILRRFVTPASDKAAGVQPESGYVPDGAPHPMGVDRMQDQRISPVQLQATSPAIYPRTPEKRVGPDLSLTVLKLAPGRGIQRQLAGPQPGQQAPAASQDPLQALLASLDAQGSEAMVLPPPPQPAPSVVQAKLAEGTQPVIHQPTQPLLPLVQPRTTQPTPTQVIQREVAPPEVTPVGEMPTVQGEFVQRAEGEEEELGEPEELDLADLARRIYPLVKRMLAIERERRPNR